MALNKSKSTSKMTKDDAQDVIVSQISQNEQEDRKMINTRWRNTLVIAVVLFILILIRCWLVGFVYRVSGFSFANECTGYSLSAFKSSLASYFKDLGVTSNGGIQYVSVDEQGNLSVNNLPTPANPLAGINGQDGIVSVNSNGTITVIPASSLNGVDGLNGSNGIAGPIGPVGPSGNGGASGTTGPQGPTGNAGSPGIAGPAGAPGLPGSILTINGQIGPTITFTGTNPIVVTTGVNSVDYSCPTCASLTGNNIWTGTNTWQNTSTFNGPTNINNTLTTTGPNILGGNTTINNLTTTGTVTNNGPVINNSTVTNNGPTTFNNTVTFTTLPNLPLPTDNIFVGVGGIATAVVPGVAGQVLTIVGTTPTWTAPTGGAFTAAGSAGINQNIAAGDTLTIAAGLNMATTGGAVDTVTVATVPNPTFDSITTTVGPNNFAGTTNTSTLNATGPVSFTGPTFTTSVATTSTFNGPTNLNGVTNINNTLNTTGPNNLGGNTTINNLTVTGPLSLPLATNNIFVGVAGVATATPPGANGTILTVVGGVPTWSAAAPSGAFTLAGSAGANQNIAGGDTMSVLGTGPITTTASATDTLTVDCPTCITTTSLANTGDLVQGAGVLLTGTLTDRLVGATNVSVALDPATIAVTAQNSITGNGSTGTPLQLVNDSLAPGNNFFYGTSGAGVKGYQSLATALAGTTTNVLTWDATTGITSNVNGVIDNVPNPAGVINNVLGYDAGGNPVIQSAAAFVAGASSFTLAGTSGPSQNIAPGDTMNIFAGASGNITSIASATDTITIDISATPTFTGITTTAGPNNFGGTTNTSTLNASGPVSFTGPTFTTSVGTTSTFNGPTNINGALTTVGPNNLGGNTTTNNLTVTGTFTAPAGSTGDVLAGSANIILTGTATDRLVGATNLTVDVNPNPTFNNLTATNLTTLTNVTVNGTSIFNNPATFNSTVTFTTAPSIPLPQNNIWVGNGANLQAAVAPGAIGDILMINGSSTPTWTAPGSLITGASLFALVGSAGANQTISGGDNLNILGAGPITTTASATDTLTVDCPTCITTAGGANTGDLVQGNGANISGVLTDRLVGATNVLIEVDAATTGTTAITTSNSGIESTATGIRLLGGCADGQVLKWVAGTQTWDCSADSGVGLAITSLNGLTGTNQTMVTGSAGADFNISSVGSTHTFNLPDAGIAARGVVNTGAQTFGGNKIFNNNLTTNSDFTVNGNTTIGNATTDRITVTSQVLGASPLVFQGATDNAFTTTVSLTDPTANRTINMPDASGTFAVSATGPIALSLAGDISCPTCVTSAAANTGDVTAGAGLLLTNNTERLIGSATMTINLDPATIAVSSTNSITGNGSSGSPLQLVNDIGAPPINRFYGTDGAGVKGWQTFAVSNTTAANSLITTVNGSASVGMPIVTSNAITWTKAASLTSSVNGISNTQTIPSGTLTDLVGYDVAGNTVYQTLAGLLGATPCIPTGDFACDGGNTLTSSLDLGTTDAFAFNMLTAGSTRATIDSSGNFGIGDTTPDAHLDIEGNENTEQIRISDTSNTDSVGFFTGNQDPNGTVTATNGSMYMRNDAGNQSWYMNTNSGTTWVNVTAGDCTPTGTGILNECQGTGALQALTTGDFNVAFGDGAAAAVTTGTSNVAIGPSALSLNTTGLHNVAIGHNALLNTTNSDSVAIGWLAMDANTTGNTNLGIGSEALGNNTTGNYNLGIGHNTLMQTTSSNNLAIGAWALDSNTSGDYNLGIGRDALGINTTGARNLAIGATALANNALSSDNLAIGYQALFANSSGANNLGIGTNALSSNVSGSNNIALGYQAGNNITSGSSNILIGYDIDAPVATGSNQMSIGNLIFGTGINGTGTSLSSGNIGIGNNAPSAKLHITQTDVLNNAISVIANTASAGAGVHISMPENRSLLRFQDFTNTDAVQIMQGNQNPNATVTAENGSMYFRNDAGNQSWYMNTDSGTTWVQIAGPSGVAGVPINNILSSTGVGNLTVAAADTQTWNFNTTALNGFTQSYNTLTTGKGLNLVGASTITGAGNLLSASTNSANASTNGFVNYTFSGAHSGPGFQIDDSSNAGTAQQINVNGLLTGNGLGITGNFVTSGDLLSVNSTSTGAFTTDGAVDFNFSGAHTGTAVGIRGGGTAGTALGVQATGLNGGSAIDISTPQDQTVINMINVSNAEQVQIVTGVIDPNGTVNKSNGSMYFRTNAGSHSWWMNTSAAAGGTVWTQVAGPNGATNIYNTNGTLTAARTLTNGGFDLTFDGSAQDVVFDSTGALLVNTTVPTAGKVAVFAGDVDVQGVIDPDALLFSNGTTATHDEIAQNGFRIGVTGVSQRPIYVSPMTDDARAFEIRNVANTSFFTADSTNMRIGINDTSPVAQLDLGANGTSTGINFDGVATGTPNVSAAGDARMFFNSTTNTFYCSVNGGAYADCASGAMGTVSGSTRLNAILAANGSNTIDSLNNAQTWNWSTLANQTAMTMNANAATTGSLLNLSTTNTGFASGNGLLAINATGAGNDGTAARIITNTDIGNGLVIDANSINAGGTGMTLQSSTTGNITSGLMLVSATGNFTGRAVSISAPNTTAGHALVVGADNQDAGNTLYVVASDTNGHTTGSALHVQDNSGVNTSNGAVRFSFPTAGRSGIGVLIEDATSNSGTSLKINSTGGSNGSTVISMTKAVAATVNPWLLMNDATDTFGFYNRAGSPESNIAANIGSIATDTTNGRLYVKTTDTVATGWSQLLSSGAIAINDLSDGITDYTNDNIFMGDTAGDSVAAGANFNVGLGVNVLTGALTGDHNVAMGHQAMQSADSASYNIALGSYALMSTTSGSQSVGIGYNSLAAMTTGSSNVAIGASSLSDLTIATNNVAVGINALTNNQTGDNNVAVGAAALELLSSGTENTAVGTYALKNSTASSNTALGFYALKDNTTGTNNLALGVSALEKNITGSSSIAIGNDALFLATGGTNIALGHLAGDSITTGSGNIIIGNSLDTSVATATNELNIGGLLFGTGINALTGSIGIGNNAPSAKLHVTHTGTTTDAMTVTAGSLTTGRGLEIITTNGAQTGNSLFTGSATTGNTSTGIAYFDFYGGHTGRGIYVNDQTSTGTTMYLDSPTLTTGNALSINNIGSTATGSIFSLTSGSSSAFTNGGARFNFTGAHTGNGFQIDDATQTGNVAVINANSLTTGSALSITAGASLGAGNLLNLSSTSGGAFTNGAVRINLTGSHTGIGTYIIDNTAGGSGVAVATNSLTTGVGMTVTNSGTGLTTGNVFNVTSSANGSPSNGIVKFDFGGARTGGYGFRIQDATTTGTSMLINVDSLTTGNGLYISNATSHSSADDLLVLRGGNNGAAETGTHIQFMRPDGTVIGSVAQNAATTVTYNTSSDRRIKENVADTSKGLEDLMKIQVRDYSYIYDPNHSTQTGLIAQELQDIYGQAVSTNGDDGLVGLDGKATPWGIDYGKLTPLIIKGVQQQQAQITTLSLDLDGLKADVTTHNEVLGSAEQTEEPTGLLAMVTEAINKFFESMTVAFNKTATFLSGAVFKGDTKFEGTVTMASNAGGTAVVKSGQTEVVVSFSPAFNTSPLVTVNVNDFSARAIVKNVTATGFTIELDKSYDKDINLTWTAVSVAGATTSESANNTQPTSNIEVSPSPTDAPAPSEVPSVTPVAETLTVSPTPEVTVTTKVSPTVEPTTTVTNPTTEPTNTQ